MSKVKAPALDVAAQLDQELNALNDQNGTLRKLIAAQKTRTALLKEFMDAQREFQLESINIQQKLHEYSRLPTILPPQLEHHVPPQAQARYADDLDSALEDPPLDMPRVLRPQPPNVQQFQPPPIPHHQNVGPRPQIRANGRQQ